MAAHGADPIGAGRACIAYLTLTLPGGAIAHMHVNWLSPTKVRTTMVSGSKRTLVWDDLHPTQRISVFDRGVDLTPREQLGAEQRREALVHTAAATWSPPHCRSGRRSAESWPSSPSRSGRAAPPCTDGRAGLRVLDILEAASQSLDFARRRCAAAGSAVSAAQPLRGQRRSSPAAPARSARPSSTCSSTPASRGRRAGQLRPRPAWPTWPTRWTGGRSRWSTATSATATSCAELTRGMDVVFHQAAIRITQCAEEPRLALEVLVDGTFNVLEAAAEAGVRKLVASSSASVYGLADRVPDRRSATTPTTTTRFYGAAKAFNEGMLRSFHAMYGLDYVALRYFNVYGPRMDVHGLYTEVLVRWMERIDGGEPPLIFGDGRRRWTSSTSATSRGPTSWPPRPTSPTRCSTSRAGSRRACSSSPRRCCGSMDSDLAVEYGPARAVNGVTRRLADTSERRGDSVSGPRSGSRRACARSSTGGGPSGPSASPGRP